MTKDISINDPRALLGSTIIALREKRGLSQKALAQALKMSPTTVNKWERGTRWPEYESLPLIAQALGVSVMDLFSWAPAPPAPPSIAALAAEVDRQAAEITRLTRELARSKETALTGFKRELFDLIAGLNEVQAEGLLRLICRTLEFSRSSNDLQEPQVLGKKPRR